MPGFSFLLVVLSIILLFLVAGYIGASYLIRVRKAAGASIGEIKDEMEARKSVFTIIGGIAFIITASYSFYEFSLKQRAESRQLIYGALSQLKDAESKRPEISAAALLQFAQLASYSESERPALIQIVSSYLNEQAKKTADKYDPGFARADIQVGIYVLSKLIDGHPELGKFVFLKKVDLRHVRLLDKPRFINVNMIEVDFRNSILDGANFSGSDLTSADFSDTILTGARFDKTTVDFARFDGANVTGVNFCNLESRQSAELANPGMAEGAKCLDQ